MQDYKAGDVFWAIHKKIGSVEQVGVARKNTYGWEFNTVDRINEKKPYLPV